MTKVGIIKFLILLIFVGPVALGQKKVKYKDIWGFLSTQQYTEAEPFLKQYLTQEDDDPNALLYMGIVFQNKSEQFDILKETTPLIQALDSAAFFYKKAHDLMTEKELKRNKEYYQNYNRRDLRTGEFGIKLADVQFDLEKKIEAVKIRSDQVKIVSHFFNASSALYEKCQSTFQEIQSSYLDINDLILGGDEHAHDQLKTLSSRFDSVKNFIENYQASLKSLEGHGYQQEFSMQEIKDFKKDGKDLSNFYDKQVVLWDYKSFSDQVRKITDEIILPMRKTFIDIEDRLNTLRETLNDQKKSVLKETMALEEEIKALPLKNYDADPFPTKMFLMKISDLRYKSVRIEDEVFKDSLDINFQLAIAKKENDELMKLSDAVDKLTQVDLEAQKKYYNDYLTNAYHNTVVLESYIKATSDYLDKEKRLSQERLKQRVEASKWLLVGSDSIPLVDSSTQQFEPLVLNDRFTLGIKYPDSVKVVGYFYDINPAHNPSIRVGFELKEPLFGIGMRDNIGGLAFDADGQVFYLAIFNSQPITNEEIQYPVVIAKVYRSDGLSWSTGYELPFIPAEINFDSSSGDLILKGSDQKAVFDKNGKKK